VVDLDGLSFLHCDGVGGGWLVGFFSSEGEEGLAWLVTCAVYIVYTVID
jgi:hypothetical protein